MRVRVTLHVVPPRFLVVCDHGHQFDARVLAGEFSPPVVFPLAVLEVLPGSPPAGSQGGHAL
eukprot:15203281-Heterocapsa_arctica.AAC.1